MTAKDILGKAAAMLDARANDRDKPDGERSMGKIVGCFNIATGHNLSERDGWLFMVFLKAVRAATTPHGKPDDYIDGPAYFALAGEAAETSSSRHKQGGLIDLSEEAASKILGRR